MLRNIEEISRQRVLVALEQHSKVFDFFKKGLYKESEQALCEHLQDSKENVLNRIRSRFQIVYFEDSAKS